MYRFINKYLNKRNNSQDPVPTDDIVQKNVKYEWGNINVNEFLQKLSKEGITDAKVESSGGSVMIHLVYQFTYCLD